MRRHVRRYWRHYLAGLAATAGGALALVLLVAWSGVYNIAASRGHWAAVEWFLTFGMQSSVRTHALGIDPPPLDDSDLVALGAGHFHGGCAYCHGAPGMSRNPVALSMLPPPPELSTSMRPWRDRELFWIVKHGIKYTGMPAWTVQSRDDEVWSVVAFLRRMPGMQPDRYRAMALGDVVPKDRTGAEIATTEQTSEAVGACARCHGAGRQSPQSDLVPLLHGQPEPFLVRALKEYAGGLRPSGIMQPVANDLTPDDLQDVARYYAKLPAPAPKRPDVDDATMQLGRQLAESGDQARGVPACNACHDSGALPTYPRLAGQNARYMANRIELWRHGAAGSTDADVIMAPVARALDERQIRAVTAYYARQSRARGATAP